MTSEEAISDFNPNNGVSDPNKVTPEHDADTVTDRDGSVSDGTNVEDNSTNYSSVESASNQISQDSHHRIEETQKTDAVSHTSVEENSGILENKLVSDPTNKQETVGVENKTSPLEQQIDEITIGTPLLENTAHQKMQVEIRREGDRLVLTLPTVSEASVSEYSWSEIWQQMKLRLSAQKRFFSSKISVHLIAYDRLLDSRQLQDIADTLSEFSLQLKSVGTSRRQTAIAAAGAGYSVEQLQPKTAFSFEVSKANLPPAETLYMETTVRSGVEIRHRGSVIILGDVNPGGIVVADGDILIWGRLRGVAHAGAQGNSECTIMALQMEPTQLRIANALARAPEKSPTQTTPEVAYMTTQGIRITKANDFSRISY